MKKETNKNQTTKKPPKMGWCVYMSVNSLIWDSFENTFVLQNQKTESNPSSYLLPMAVISSFSRFGYRV